MSHTAVLEEYMCPPASPTDALANDLSQHRDFLEATHDMAELGLQPVEVIFFHSEGPHMVLGIDLSNQPGDSFKYATALGTGLSVEAGVDTAVTASAGGYSRALGKVGLRLGMQVIAYTPHDLNEVKRLGMKADSVEIHPYYDNVAEALPAAKHDADTRSDWAFFHPYDNADGIALLTYLTDQVVDVVADLETSGVVDISALDVKFLVQRGGGSLISAVSMSVRQAKREGRLPDSVSVVEVRPERLPNGELDPLYDGLRVAEPGDIAKQFLDDKEYVQEHYEFSQTAVADAARRVYTETEALHEANSLAGVAAFEEMSLRSVKPTLYVTLLTGRNATTEQRNYMLNHDGFDGEYYLPESTTPVPLGKERVVGSALMSGFTAQERVFAELPSARSQDLGKAPANYYDHMVDSGVELLSVAGAERIED